MGALFVATVGLLWFGVPPLPQSLAYHNFADQRSLCCGVVKIDLSVDVHCFSVCACLLVCYFQRAVDF